MVVNSDQLKKVGQRWGETWGFDVSTVVASLPDMDPWVVGAAGDAPCLLGLIGERACCVTARSDGEIETVIAGAAELDATVRDSFSDQNRAHAHSGAHLGRQRRVWTFTLGDVEVTVSSDRGHIYGRDAALGAEDHDWPEVEAGCRVLAFGQSAHGPADD